MAVRSAPGTYVLHIEVSRCQTVQVGRRGAMPVEPGTYAYVGSAFGPGGVRARVMRHQRGTDAPHWHIDYFRPAGRLRQVWCTYDAVRRECLWADVLRALPGAGVPHPGFGASDCSCAAHLLYRRRGFRLAAFRERLLPRGQAHAPIHVVSPGALNSVL